tara:strand:+ start:691 stop:1950 length:1260 start_codon:yes stop_codon:yes gene_type:complete
MIFFDAIIHNTYSNEVLFPLTRSALILGTLPRVSLSIRRLRDVGKSGWWFLFPFPLPFWIWVWDVSSDHKRSNETEKSNQKNNNQNYKKDFSSEDLLERLGKIGEAEGLGAFNFNRFFGGINKPHTVEEIEESLIVGTQFTTPKIEDISLDYPQPWLFFRLVTFSVVLFYAFVFAYYAFENINLVPGLIFSGSFAVPISTLFLFYELNIRRNIPLWQIMRLVLFGGILSMFIALVLFANTETLSYAFGASAAGIVEEPAKLGALLILMRGERIKKYPYILNGLLLGAAVGCGFAAFESAGYALNTGLTSSVDEMIENIQIRGILSPFAHIVWTAASGAAMWRVLKGGKFKFKLLQRNEFKKPFLVIVLCHFIWNSGFNLPFFGTYIICGGVAWVVALSLVNLGIKQIADEKSGKEVFKT